MEIPEEFINKLRSSFFQNIVVLFICYYFLNRIVCCFFTLTGIGLTELNELRDSVIMVPQRKADHVVWSVLLYYRLITIKRGL